MSSPFSEQKAPSSQRKRQLIIRTRGIPGVPTRIELVINPEDLKLDLPSRTTTSHTILGAYQDTWGHGIGTLQFSGTTGWRELRKNTGDGIAWFNRLNKVHHEYLSAVANDVPEKVQLWVVLPPYTIPVDELAPPSLTEDPQPGVPVQPVFAAPAGLQSSDIYAAFYQVSSDNFTILRNRGAPLLFRYEWRMTLLQDMLHPPPTPSKRLELDPAGDLAAGQQTGNAGGGSGGSPGSGDRLPPGLPPGPPSASAPGGPDAFALASLPPVGQGGALATGGTRVGQSVLAPTTLGALPPLDPFLITTLGGDTVRTILERLRLPTAQIRRISTLNGLATDTPLPPGVVISLPNPLLGGS